MSECRHRVFVVGAGGSLDVGANNTLAVGSTTVPLTTQAPFSASGGLFVAGPQRCTYTGISADAGKGTVADGILQSPGGITVSPAGVAGNMAAGTYYYKLTLVKAHGEESEAGAGYSNTIANVTAPGALTPTVSTTLSGNVAPATYTYKVTFLTGNGETLGGTTSGSAVVPSISTLSCASVSTSGFTTGGSLTLLGGYYYCMTAVSTAGETILGTRSGLFTLTGSNNRIPLTNLPTSADGRVTARRLYRNTGNSNPSGPFALVTTINDNSTTTFSDGVADASLGAQAPLVDTASHGRVSLTSIPTSGDARVTRRRVFRTTATDSTAWKLLTTIADNSTTTYTDNSADASLGEVTPTVSTANNGKMSLTSIALGGPGTVSRRLYRTKADEATWFYCASINDASTTTYIDNTPDASLGVVAPAVSHWRTLAGSTTLRVSDLAQFSEGFGWVKVGSQVVRFTSRAAGSGAGDLQGIPASGVGALVSDVLFGTEVIAMPFLKGVPSSGAGSILYALIQGDAVNICVQRDNTAAQAALALREGGDGIHEYTLHDSTLESVAQCNERGDAELAMFKDPKVTIGLKTRDTKAAPGRSVPVNWGVWTGTFKIQRIEITEIGTAVNTPPLVSITASNTKYTLQDLLRQLGGGLGVREGTGGRRR